MSYKEDAYEESAKRKRFSIIFIVILITLTISYSLFQRWEINNAPVFVIGKLEGSRITSKGLAVFTHYYFYKGTKYTYERNASYMDSLIFLKVSKKNPSNSMYIKETVPSCLVIEDVPKNGWDELPNIKCK